MAEPPSTPQRQSRGEALIVPRDATSIAFVRGLVARGEAARPAPDGSLPKGATHEIVGEAENGLPIVKRRRFAAF